jgi:hypothetical protein
MILNLELDEALVAQLESAARSQGVSAREFIRNALQRAATSPFSRANPVRFSQRVHDFGAHIESAWTVLAEIESDEYVRKFARK